MCYGVQLHARMYKRMRDYDRYCEGVQYPVRACKEVGRCVRV